MQIRDATWLDFCSKYRQMVSRWTSGLNKESLILRLCGYQFLIAVNSKHTMNNAISIERIKRNTPY